MLYLDLEIFCFVYGLFALSIPSHWKPNLLDRFFFVLETEILFSKIKMMTFFVFLFSGIFHHWIRVDQKNQNKTKHFFWRHFFQFGKIFESEIQSKRKEKNQIQQWLKPNERKFNDFFSIFYYRNDAKKSRIRLETKIKMKR